jgi:hypothetical protein
MLHQSLALEALPDPALEPWIFRVKPGLFFHSAAVYQPPCPCLGLVSHVSQPNAAYSF